MCHSVITVGIVLFNPNDDKRFLRCIQSVLSQVDKIYIYDNSPSELRFHLPKEVSYMTEHKNSGIAYALNRIMESAEEDGFQWVITMDQDSLLPPKLVEAYFKHISDTAIGIICPQVIDLRRAYMEVKKSPNEEYIEECITSASCTSIRVWKSIGKFDERLFIDLVDNEFCKRLIVSGYKILRLNGFVLNQEFGNIIPKPRNKQQFWIKLSKILHNQNIAKFSYVKFVSPMRVYYTNRNIIYVNRKLKNYGPIAYSNYNCKGYIGFIINFCIPSFIRAQKKRKILVAIIKGMLDGVNMKVQPWNPNYISNIKDDQRAEL